MSNEPQPVYEFEKARATVRAYINEFRGKRYAHIREFVEPRDHPGAELVATKAGICVEVSDLDELEAAVQALRGAQMGQYKAPTREQDTPVMEVENRARTMNTSVPVKQARNNGGSGLATQASGAVEPG